MSPVLFDVFINDLLDYCGDRGVLVEGTRGEKLAGLLFADDLVLMASSRHQLRKLLRAVEKWAEDWEMAFGIAKCGLMVVGGSANQFDGATWELQGQALPVVEEYTYLGIQFNSRLDLKEVVKARELKARRALEACRGFLRTKSIPVHIRRQVLRALVMPVATFGGELFGNNVALVNPLQKVMDEATRMLAGMACRSNACAAVVLRQELQIPSVAAVTSGLRARAWRKYLGAASWIGTLRVNPLKDQNATWVSGTARWLKRYAPQALGDTENPRSVNAIVQQVVLDREVAGATRVRRNGVPARITVTRFCDAGYENSVEYLKDAAQCPELAVGVLYLLQCRTGAFWTAKRAAKSGLIDDRYRNECPCCGNAVPETLEHMMLVCPKWEYLRQRMFQAFEERLGLGDWVGLLRDENRVMRVLLGGEAAGSSSEAWSTSSVDDSNNHIAGLYRVTAGFLMKVQKRRLRLVWATSTMSRRPNG